MVGKLRMCKTQRLRHVNIFKQMPMEECILKIKLMKNLASRYNKREDCMYCGRFDYRVECLTEIRTRYLMKPLSD